MLANKLMSALSGAEEEFHVDDVFSTYLYTGNGSTQTINNGIDLAGKGGMVWGKSRTQHYDHFLVDTVRGAHQTLFSNGTGLNQNYSSSSGTIGNFGATGFTVGTYTLANQSGQSYASWTFRKAPKFFDAVTYTGNGSFRWLNHSLGAIPGMILVKRTDSAGGWVVYHIGVGNAAHFLLNAPNEVTTWSALWGTADPTASQFRISNDPTMNALGGTYVAYLFAHDPSADGIIQCGSYTGNSSAAGPIVNLGWEPQYLMVKSASGTGNWQIIDSMRGMLEGSADATLQANLSNNEVSADYVSPTAIGFQVTSTSSEVNTNGRTYIYLAIRRSNKPPKSGTEVYSNTPATYGQEVVVGFPPDLWIGQDRGGGANFVCDKVRGAEYLSTMFTYSAYPNSNVKFDQRTNTFINNLQSGSRNDHFFRRAPGFFDIVCYTGTGVARTVPHGLGVAPELMIVKGRTDATSYTNLYWAVYNSTIGNAMFLRLDTPLAKTGVGLEWWTANGTSRKSPDASNFYVGTALQVNGSTEKFVAYLFASLPGISKVGSYTGNGTTQTINCGFTTGARFILIKRTDAAGDWYVWDTARGIIAANDPHLSLNTTAAEVTTDDSVDPDVSGFIVNQVAATNINVSGGQYIFLAIA